MGRLWNNLKSYWESLYLPLRGILGLYAIDSAENPNFDPTIRQHFDRLRSDFLLIRIPTAPTPPPAQDKTATADQTASTQSTTATANPQTGQTPQSASDSETSQADAKDKLTAADLRYLEQTHKRGKALIDDLEGNRAKLTAAVLYEIESIIIALSNLEALKQGYQSLQDRYHAVAGAEVFEKYLGAQRPVVSTSNDIDLYRADSLFLIGQIRRYNIINPRREQIRRWLLIDVILLVLLVLLAVGIWITLQPHSRTLVVLRMVAIAALLGGFTSVLQRIQTIPEDQLGLSLWSRISVVIGPLTAIVFALVLYEIFDAGLVMGGFFPKMTDLYWPDTSHVWQPLPNLPKPGGDIYRIFTMLSRIEFAKLMVWSFISGFSERFVPDTLNALIDRQKTASNK